MSHNVAASQANSEDHSPRGERTTTFKVRPHGFGARRFNVLSASTPEAATRIEQEFTGTIDLLLTGVSMPGRSGPDLGEQLQKSRPGLRVMLMSSDPAAQTLAASHGWCFTVKPFSCSDLLDKVASALAPS